MHHDAARRERTHRVDRSGNVGAHALRYPSARGDRGRDRIGRRGYADLVAHVGEPTAAIGADPPLDAAARADTAKVLEVARPRALERADVRKRPCLGSAAEARHEVLAEQSSPLWCTPVVVVEDAAVVDEDDANVG